MLQGTLNRQRRQRQRRSGGKKNWDFFVILVFYYLSIYLLSIRNPVCFYVLWNSVDSSVSFWTKQWRLVLEMSVTFWRQRGNGAVKVSYESRTISALFQIFTYVFLEAQSNFFILSFLSFSVQIKDYVLQGDELSLSSRVEQSQLLVSLVRK